MLYCSFSYKAQPVTINNLKTIVQTNTDNTRLHGLLKIVIMSDQCVICQVNVAELQLNYFLH